MAITINSTPILTPTTFSVRDVPIVRTVRLASGTLKKRTIATKKRFTLAYNDITGSELSTIIGAIGAGAFVTLGYPNETTDTTATVTLASDIPRELWTASPSKRYRGVSFELDEQ